MSEWISVKERLPEHGAFLVTDGKQIRFAYGEWLFRSPDGVLRVPANNGAGMDVTHWMPLPTPPGEEDYHDRI